MLIGLCYASTRAEHQNDLLQEISDILATARQFNAAQHINGVLYYAEGHFFQCLEGEQQQLASNYLAYSTGPAPPLMSFASLTKYLSMSILQNGL